MNSNKYSWEKKTKPMWLNVFPRPFTGSTDIRPVLLPSSDHLPADCAGKPAYHCAQSHRLQTPHTYVLFLRNLSFADLCFSITTVPQVLVYFLVKKKTISSAGCSTQIAVLLQNSCTECALLAVMSYDCYVAVCKLLHYSTIMTHQMAIGSWASGVFVSLVDSTFTLRLPYWGNNIINLCVCVNLLHSWS